MRRSRRALLIVAALALTGAGAPPPRRIVSLNLCTDQLLLFLADKSQIAALTSNAADPTWSAEAAHANGLRRLRGSAEELLAMQPDLVVGMPATGSLLLPPGRAYRTLDLANADSYADIVASIRTLARAVGHPDRGEALIARMNADLARIGRPGRGKVAAYYQRRGYLSGTGTLVDELMTRVGLVNLAGRLGKPTLSQLSLEELVAAKPDYLIVDAATKTVADQGTEMLHHPALAAVARLQVPQSWTICGGPAYVRAAQSLARQIGRDR